MQKALKATHDARILAWGGYEIVGDEVLVMEARHDL